MLTLRPLPPQFLLPSWSCQHLRKLQRARSRHSSQLSTATCYEHRPQSVPSRASSSQARCANVKSSSERSICNRRSQTSACFPTSCQCRHPVKANEQRRNIHVRYHWNDTPGFHAPSWNPQWRQPSGTKSLEPRSESTSQRPAGRIKPSKPRSTTLEDLKHKTAKEQQRTLAQTGKPKERSIDSVASEGWSKGGIGSRRKPKVKHQVPQKDNYKPFPPEAEDENGNEKEKAQPSATSKELGQETNTDDALEIKIAKLQKELAHAQAQLKQKNEDHLSSSTTHTLSTSENGNEPRGYNKSDKQISLLEQLFPDEAEKQKQARLKSSSPPTHEFPDEDEPPRLQLPQLEITNDFYDRMSRPIEIEPKAIQQPSYQAPVELYKEEDLTVMIMSNLSTGLANADFQRIIPRGQHIEEWRGPGDVLKVIPLRHPISLAPSGSYLLVFANPAYARAFKTHVEHLHELSRKHAPSTTHEIFRTDRVNHMEQAEIQQTLADYSLCPPSQRLYCQIIFPPYRARIRRVLADKGYEQITKPEEKTGRSVLMWTEGHVPRLWAMEKWLKRDGFDRGVPWSPVTMKGGLQKLEKPEPLNRRGEEEEEDDNEDADESTERRWMLTFEDETEARRFIRTWHRRPWPAEDLRDLQDENEPAPLVNVELLW